MGNGAIIELTYETDIYLSTVGPNNMRKLLFLSYVKTSNTNEQKIHFNKELSKLHAPAENVFCTLKGRWKKLQKSFNEKAETVAKTVMDCYVLQNMTIRK